MIPSHQTAEWPFWATSFVYVYPFGSETIADDLRAAFALAPDLAFYGFKSDAGILTPEVTIFYKSPLPMDAAEAAAMAVCDDALGFIVTPEMTEAISGVSEIAGLIAAPALVGVNAASSTYDAVSGSGSVAGAVSSVSTTVRIVAVAAAVLGLVYLTALIKPR